MAGSDFAVWGSGGNEILVPQPLAASYEQPIIGTRPDMTPILALEAVVAWQFGDQPRNALSEAEYDVIVAARGADGTIRFRSTNAARQFQIFTGKIDPRPAAAFRRGLALGLSLTFVKVLPWP